MAQKIFSMPLGFNDCYIIQDKGTIMIDGGAPRKIGEFETGIRNIRLKPSDSL
ncbi:MAG: hypothetical protein JSV64_03535 [Candidatus Bathyarchaeota archaeon]|nr:MAG: hypothetical protein JSV64_03535 [Candidatus Bathyarchaeota archaeon]